jgi:hypothetical protein
VELGITAREAEEHSLTELEWMLEARRRKEAREQSSALALMATAFSAVMSKKGGAGFQKLAGQLKKAAND